VAAPLFGILEQETLGPLRNVCSVAVSRCFLAGWAIHQFAGVERLLKGLDGAYPQLFGELGPLGPNLSIP
jgi:hypothetical protein